MSSHEPIKSTAVAVPPEQTAKRSSSFLKRMAKAPDDVAAGTAPPPPTAVPPRSPEGELRMRGNSKLLKRKFSDIKSAPSTTRPDVEEVRYHLMSLPEVLAALGTRDGGLSDAEADALVLKNGANVLTPPERIGIVHRYCRNLFSAFSLLMIVSGILCYIITGINTQTSGSLDVQTLALACVLVGVSLLVSGFQTYMEDASDNLMEALRRLQAEDAWVFRAGQLKRIPSANMVIGDIVKVQIGEKVPADMRLIEVTDLKVNNASLTGENSDVKCSTVVPPDTRLVEAKNIVRSGCNFTNGNGVGVVFATGDNTLFGQIAKSATTAEKPDTLMRREVSRLIVIMAVIGTTFALAFGGAAFGTGQTWAAALVITVGLFVANIPEGLLPQITLALTITARRMFERNVIVTNLEIIETLGAVSVICSDKTGTLTLNRMTVVHVIHDMLIHMTAAAPVMPTDTVRPVEAARPAVAAIMRGIALNSEATFAVRDGTDVTKWEVKGDASESAMLKFTHCSVDTDVLRKNHKRLAVIPFNARNKYMASVNQLSLPGERPRQLVSLKGAAERVLQRCSMMQTDSGEVPLTEEMREDLNKQLLSLAERGERCLGFAHLTLEMPEDFVFNADDEERNFPITGLVFLGMIAMVDPPRPTVPQAVADCHRAGIHVIMVTGDHPVTAMAISRSLGLVTLPAMSTAPPGETDFSGYAAVVTGEAMEKLSDAEWDRVLQCGEHVFARTLPEQKQQLVKRLSAIGHIVAMTGDGVNDAPALKAAHVGVGMGSGTAVAKEAAQIIVCDDDFGSVVVGIREGRQIFENLKKACCYVLTHLGPEMIPYILNFALMMPQAIETIVILIIDLGTEMFPGICLAYEEAEERVMDIPPRKADDHLVCARAVVQGYGFIGGVIETFFCYWAFIWTFADFGFSFRSIILGPSAGYRGLFSALTEVQQNNFRDICMSNAKYQATNPGGCATAVGMELFLAHFSTVVSHAESAFFFALVELQVIHIFCRRSQTVSLFSPSQTFNWRMVPSVMFSVAFACFFVYCPGVNAAFYLAPVSAANATCALWGVPVLLAIEELRKFFCRTWPDGLVATWTIY